MSKSATITRKNAKKTTTKKPAAAKPALLSKVAYTIVYVPDMKKAVEFYKSIGLKLANESPYWSEFDAGIKFALHIADEGWKPVETNISFGVPSAFKTYETLKAMGIAVTEPHQVCEEGGYCFGFKDCFGNGLSAYGEK